MHFSHLIIENMGFLECHANVVSVCVCVKSTAFILHFKTRWGTEDAEGLNQLLPTGFVLGFFFFPPIFECFPWAFCRRDTWNKSCGFVKHSIQLVRLTAPSGWARCQSLSSTLALFSFFSYPCCSEMKWQTWLTVLLLSNNAPCATRWSLFDTSFVPECSRMK